MKMPWYLAQKPAGALVVGLAGPVAPGGRLFCGRPWTLPKVGPPCPVLETVSG